MAKNINGTEFTKETMLKLDIFRKCFREWYPVFLHNQYITHLYIYDMFAGSGRDAVGNYGSPLILLQEAIGDKRQHCEFLVSHKNKPNVVFGFNEKDEVKSKELKKNVDSELSECKNNCNYGSCPFKGKTFVETKKFKELIQGDKVNYILNNRNYAKFILLDQYGFSQIDDDIFLKLVNSPKTDFIFFIASSFIRRFQTLESVKAYFQNNNFVFDESKPNECHRVITDYFRTLIPSEKEYYLHSFTIQKGCNYYGLIFGSNHTLGMEKFLRVCWSEDKLAGESNCNINNDYVEGTLFYDPTISNKKQEVSILLEKKILRNDITNNIDGLKYVMKQGCEPRLFVEVIDKLLLTQKIVIDGDFNRTATNIHKVNKYSIVVK